MDNSSQTLQMPFPSLEYKALWAPIYWEPILLSGERITAVIAAIGLDGRVSVSTCIRGEALKALFPENHLHALSLIAWVAKSLEQHLIDGGSLYDWESPITGFCIGNQHEIFSTAIEAIPTQVIPLCSSLSQIEIAQEAKVKITRELSLDVIKASIRSNLVERLPRLKGSFCVPFSVKEGARKATIDFVGSRIAVNFSKLSVSNLLRNVKDTKAQIVDLVTYRERANLFKENEIYQMMLWSPKFIDSEQEKGLIKEAFLELEDEANHFGLKVAQPLDPIIAASDIFQIEAAA